MTIHAGQDVFEMTCDLIDATSLSRPDTAWCFIDAAGHEHRWHVGDLPATSYNPSGTYHVPSLVWVKDGEEWFEYDDEPHDVGHYECRLCGEHIEPRYRADDTRQQIAGLRHYSINGESVSEEEFRRRWEAARG